MHTLAVSYQDGVCHADLPLSELAPRLAANQGTLWLDLVQPDAAELALLTDVFKFHPLAVEDSLREQQRPKVESYGTYYFIVFYAASYDDDDEKLRTLPVHLFVGPRFLVSIHRDELPVLTETAQRWQAPSSPLGRTVGALVYALLDAIVDDYFPLIDQFADRVEALEEQIFEQFDEAAIQTIFGLKKDLLALRRTMSPERDVMNMLLRREVPVFSNEDVVYLQDVYDHLIRVTDTVDTYRDLLSSALDSFLSVQSNKLNQIVKVLTITSIVLMSDALIAGIYGMNFEFMPELHLRYGYAYALALMLVISVGLVLFFRRKRWL